MNREKKVITTEAGKYRQQATDLLYDALRFHANLNPPQLAAIRGILNTLALHPEEFDQQHVKDIDRLLCNADLDTIP